MRTGEPELVTDVRDERRAALGVDARCCASRSRGRAGPIGALSLLGARPTARRTQSWRASSRAAPRPRSQTARSEQRYRMLFERNPLPMWVYDVETLGFLAVNDAAVRHYGYSREEFLAMTITDIRPPEDVPALLADAPARRPGLPDRRARGATAARTAR